jgi:hypothetical protein
MIVATVVDDSVVAYSHESLFTKFRTFVEERLPITVTPLEHVAGMRVKQNPDGSISVDQQEYIEKKAEAFGCKGGRRCNTPMCESFKLGSRPSIVDAGRVKYARQLMGTLIYATLTRPECKYACSKLASVVTNPSKADIAAMERVLRYLYFTRETALKFKPGSWEGSNGNVHDPLELAIYVDAGFAQEEGRRSQTGFALMFAGAAISAKSGKQTQVSDSTPYAETIALHEAANWALVLRKSLAKLFASQTCPTKMYEDNQAAIVFANRGGGPRSLHWDVKLEYVHELQRKGDISVLKIDTKLQVADVLTKALPEQEHLLLTAYLLGGPVVFSD